VNEPNQLDYVTAIASVATPILVLILTALGWTIRNRIERARNIEEKLRDDRIQIYQEILEPFIIILTKEEGIATEKAYRGKTKEQIAIEKIVSVKYRQTAFELALIGSDDVVRAYNKMMQFFFSDSLTKAQDKEAEIKKLWRLLGDFLLAIRRSVGNEKTSLENLEMLEWLITDIDNYRR
jgi:hypothetical protein